MCVHRNPYKYLHAILPTTMVSTMRVPTTIHTLRQHVRFLCMSPGMAVHAEDSESADRPIPKAACAYIVYTNPKP